MKKVHFYKQTQPDWFFIPGAYIHFGKEHQTNKIVIIELGIYFLCWRFMMFFYRR